MSGFVMSTAAFLAESSASNLPAQINLELAGNICRCTGYSKIVEAILDLSQQTEVLQRIKQDWQNEFGVQ
jgi:carbon-monoxide dehydrogenase small subunit